MFVQYSFVQPRAPTPARDAWHFELSPSLVVAIGVGCMVLTALGFLSSAT